MRSSHDCLWYHVLCSKYNHGNFLQVKRKSMRDSLWWRDLVGIFREGVIDGWFEKIIVWRMGNGRLIQFLEGSLGG